MEKSRIPEPGWLSRQFREIKRDRETWPSWMRIQDKMSLLPMTYGCDWPRCTNNVTFDAADYSLEDFGWEGRLHDGGQPKLHVCPFHARESQRALLKALLEAEEKGYWKALREETKNV